MRTPVRITGAVLTAVLLTGGCGGGDGGGDGGDAESSTATPTVAETEPTGPAPTGGPLQGTWLSGSGEDAVVLSVFEGEAALIGGTTCAGSLTDDTTLELSCPGADGERGKGTLELDEDGKKLEISWEQGGRETFEKVETPEDMPSDFPSVLPDDLDLPSPPEPPAAE